MLDFGKSLINMDPDERKKMLGNATPGQRKSALEMGIGFNNKNQRQQQRQQKRDGYHDLDRLNTIVEKENEAHDFFGKGLADWRKNVTGSNPSGDAANLKKQFDDYEHSILSGVPKGGKRHEALSKSLPGIKGGFLKQGTNSPWTSSTSGPGASSTRGCGASPKAHSEPGPRPASRPTMTRPSPSSTGTCCPGPSSTRRTPTPCTDGNTATSTSNGSTS